MKTLRILAAVAAFSLLGGCAPSWSTAELKPATGVTIPEAVETGKTPAADILVTEEDITDRPYRVLGEIEVTVNKTTIFHEDPTSEMVAAKLREEAAKIGADAVILVRYGTVGISLMSWGSLDGQGRAVAFTD